MIFKVGVRNLLRNPRRTLAILITVALGTSSLFLFQGFNEGVMDQYKVGTIHSRFGHGQINSKGYRNQVFEKPWEHWISGWEGLRSSILSTPGVKQVFPRLEFFALLTNGRITVSGRGQGVDGPEESKFFTAMNIESGETLSDQPDGLLLGSGLAASLAVKPGDRVTVLANTINGSMNGGDFTVTGIAHTGLKEFDDIFFRIPLKQAQFLLDTDRIESMVIGLDQDDGFPVVEAKVQSDYPQLEATPFAVLDEVYYQHSVDWLKSQFGVIQGIIITIVVLGIFNTVSTMILERKQEIGNLRANGESVGDVMGLFLSEGIGLGVLGSVAGIAIASFLVFVPLRHGILMPPAPGITRQFHVMIELEPMMAVKALVMGISAALTGTLIAGYRVAKLPIGEALRSL